MQSPLDLKFGLLLIGLPFAFNAYGITGAIVFVTASEVFRYAPLLIGQIREGFSFLKQDLAITLLMFLFIGLWEWIRSVFGLGTTFGVIGL